MPYGLRYFDSIVIGTFSTHLHTAAHPREGYAHGNDPVTLMFPMGLFGAWAGLDSPLSGIKMEEKNVLPRFIMNTFAPVVANVI